MNFLEKLGKVLVKNMAYTVMFVIALLFFLYFTEGHIIAGALIALSALIMYITATLLYGEYKKMPKTVAKKAPAKKKK